MRVADEAFQQLFRHLFVYNMLFEDTEVDEKFLQVGSSSRILGISGAGCGIAGHLSRQPQSIDAVDINARHLAITALKASAARELVSYEEFYQVWGHGTHAQPERLTGRLTERLPRWLQHHWRANYRIFAHCFHRRGLTARLFALLRQLSGVDSTWLRSVIAEPVKERRQMIFQRFAPILRKPWVAALLRSPVHLIAIGVNHAQRERMLRAEQLDDVVDFFLMHLGRVAETDLERTGSSGMPSPVTTTMSAATPFPRSCAATITRRRSGRRPKLSFTTRTSSTCSPPPVPTGGPTTPSATHPTGCRTKPGRRCFARYSVRAPTARWSFTGRWTTASCRSATGSTGISG